LTIKRVFISSPFDKLQEERKAVQRAIARMSLNPVAMEHFGSYPGAPISRCIQLVSGSDYFVLIVGDDLGTPVPGSARTYTEQEYDAAVEFGIPILTYFRNGAASAAVASFRDSLRGQHGISRFTSPDELSWMVTTDLGREIIHSDHPRDPCSGAESLVFERFNQQKEELIRRLNSRAEAICSYFRIHRGQNIAAVLQVFEKLHSAHIDLIAEGKFTLAHDTLRLIYDLLDTAAKAEGFDQSSVLYQTSFPVPVLKVIRGNYLLGAHAPPPSSPFSTARLYDAVLANRSASAVTVAVDDFLE
jgi:hypothetical protein